MNDDNKPLTNKEIDQLNDSIHQNAIDDLEDWEGEEQTLNDLFDEY